MGMPSFKAEPLCQPGCSSSKWAIFRVVLESGRTRGWVGSSQLFPRLLLEPANVPHNLINVLGGHTLDLRHIAELPMVCTNAVRSRHLKRRIAVMVRLVDFVDQRRAVIGSGS